VWCPVCQRETSVIHRLTQQFTPKGVHTLAVLANPYRKNFETSGRRDLSLATVKDLAWYARQFNANYPLLIDPRFKAVNTYGVDAYPGLYVIGKDGRVLLSGKGYHEYSTLVSTLRHALQ
jgi:peroxiredoxin